jgi:UDP:flavonoid glycosyltransferase YjiC (YdhE family)
MIPPKKRLLFFAEAVTLAHVARPMVLAQALSGAGYEVHLACDSRYNDLFTPAPLRHRNIHTIAPARFLEALAKGSPVYDADTLRGYVREDIETIEAVQPDLVVGDFRLSLAVSAPVAGIPHIAIANAYWSPYARLRFPVPDLPLTRIMGIRAASLLFSAVRPAAFAFHTLPLNRIRKEYGLSSLGFDLRRIYTHGDYTLYADIPDWIPMADMPANHRYIGPILWSPAVPPPDWWHGLPGEKPIVYVNLGSSGPVRLLPDVLRALADLPVTVVAATAGRQRLDIVPPNAHLADYLPGAEAAARAALVVCNGGSPATQQALAAGTPVLGIGGNMDQLLNMGVLERTGAARLLRAERADPARIRAFAAEMLDRRDYGEAAIRVAELFSRYDAAERVGSLIDDILRA